MDQREAGRGDWRELGTFRFPFDTDGRGRRWPIYAGYRAGDLVVAGVKVTIAQEESFLGPHRIYVSPCAHPPACGLIFVPLDSGFLGGYRYGNITFVAFAEPVPATPTPCRQTVSTFLLFGTCLQTQKPGSTGTLTCP